MPDIGDGLTEAEVIQWLVATGDQVAANQPLVEVETDKAVVEIPSPQRGVVLHQGAEAGSVIKVGDLLVVIGDEGEAWSGAEPAVKTAPTAAVPVAAAASSTSDIAAVTATTRAVPLVRKLAKEMDVDLGAINGSGANGQITREDVLAAAAPAGSIDHGEELELSKLRRTIAEHMTRSWEEIPHVTVWGPAEATRLLAVRKSTGASLEALLVRAVLPALTEFPVFSASFDGRRLLLHKVYDIGIAVDTAAGLMVPVVRDASGMDVAALDKEIQRLVAGAQGRSLSAGELRGQSFTISNIGAVGGGYGTPIIPHGTTAVLSVGRARDDVVARHGRPVVVATMPLALSFDHRVIDGSTGTRFLNRVTEHIEQFR